MAAQSWQPHESLTKAPTNLKEAIDWVLRVTGRDGKENKAAPKPQFGCLCFLAKAVKDLLYDAKSPGSPGPSPKRYWDNMLLEQEKDIAQPVLQDLGLLSGSTSAARDTCAGGTEVIGTLIGHLAQGLQKWVGWQDVEECCLKGDSSGKSNGIGKKCGNGNESGGCCGGTSSHTCEVCRVGATGSNPTNCYQSAYNKTDALWTTIVNGGIVGAGGSGSAGSAVGGKGGTVDTVKAAQEVHLLARIFLGSVCLIWSGLSQLAFLTGGSSGRDKRWSDSELNKIAGNDKDGLGSFMAAMGYDLDRLNQGAPGTGKTGDFVWNLLSGQEPSGNNGIQWKEFKNGDANKESVAEYYSSIYKEASKSTSKTSESICKEYPLLVLHILASGYFRAGSAGANKVPVAPKAPPSDPRKPRTIREILYWLSALPYSQGYKGLVDRMEEKMEGILPKDEQDKQQKGDKYILELYNEGHKKTELKKDCITHYLLAACGYCPLVLIGIQGTINTSGSDTTSSTTSGGGGNSNGNNQGGSPNQNNGQSNKNKCPKHKDNLHKRCTLEDANKAAEAAAPAATQASAPPAGEPLQAGQVCYGGYHLAVSKFGPLHGMYANGLYGFDMGGSAAQCLDQLRVYVYHCFYQLYFLRKQCTVGVESGAVLGWKSCRYGSGVYMGSGASYKNLWKCKTEGGGNNNGQDHSKKCGLPSGAGSDTAGTQISPLMCFLCDAVGPMVCGETKGMGVDKYPSIEDHADSESPLGRHLGKPPKHCPVPMGWQTPSNSRTSTNSENHFKDLTQGTHKTDTLQNTRGDKKYPAHCTGNTLSHLLEYYCDPGKSHGSLVLVLRLLACITPTVPRTLGDLFGFYYYIVYIGGQSGGAGQGEGVYEKLEKELRDVRLSMLGSGPDAVVSALATWNSGGSSSGGGACSHSTTEGSLRTLYGCGTSSGTSKCCPYLSPLSGQQYGQLSPLMAGTYLSWLVYLIGEFKDGLEGLAKDYRGIDCKVGCQGPGGVASGCGGTNCVKGSHGVNSGGCCCDSVVSCTGVLPVLYKYGFGYGNVTELHKTQGQTKKQCHQFLETLKGVLEGNHLKKGGSQGHLHHEINKLIYTTRLPWIFVLTIAWLVAVLYLAFGAIWPLDWTHMRSHCRGWFRKGSLSPWEVLMVGKKKGRGILEFFGKT